MEKELSPEQVEIASLQAKVSDLELEVAQYKGKLADAMGIVGLIMNRSMNWAGEFEKAAHRAKEGVNDAAST